MAEEQHNGGRSSDEGPGTGAVRRSDAARASVEEAIEAARSQGEALASDIDAMVTTAAASAGRIRDLERSLAGAIVDRDEALARIASMERRIGEARARLSQQATAKLRARAEQLRVQAEAHLSSRRAELEREHDARMRHLKDREGELEARIEGEVERRLRAAQSAEASTSRVSGPSLVRSTAMRAPKTPRLAPVASQTRS